MEELKKELNLHKHDYEKVKKDIEFFKERLEICKKDVRVDKNQMNRLSALLLFAVIWFGNSVIKHMQDKNYFLSLINFGLIIMNLYSYRQYIFSCGKCAAINEKLIPGLTEQLEYLNDLLEKHKKNIDEIEAKLNGFKQV